MPEAAQAIVHIVRGGGCQTISRICKQWQYLSQNGKVQLRRSERYGGGVMEVDEFETQARAWAEQTGKYIEGQRLIDGHQELTTHIIVSFPPGTNEEDAHAAGRAWAEAMFGLGRNRIGDGADDTSDMFPLQNAWRDRPEWDYVTAFHTNRPHPHLHVVLNRRALSARGEWLAISHRNQFLNYDTLREGLADVAYEYGIALDATSREQRGLEGHGPTREQYRQRANIEFRNHFEEDFETVDIAREGGLEVFPELTGAGGGEEPAGRLTADDSAHAARSQELAADREIDEATIPNLELRRNLENLNRAQLERARREAVAERARRRQVGELRRRRDAEETEGGPSRRRTPGGAHDTSSEEAASVPDDHNHGAMAPAQAQPNPNEAGGDGSVAGGAIREQRMGEFEEQRRREIARDRARREQEGLERAEERRRARVAMMHENAEAGLAVERNVEMPDPERFDDPEHRGDDAVELPPQDGQRPLRGRHRRSEQHIETRGERIRRMAEERRARNVETRAQRRARLLAEAEARRVGAPSTHGMDVRNMARRQAREEARLTANRGDSADIRTHSQNDAAERAPRAHQRQDQPARTTRASRSRRYPNSR
ncbi:relaxase/mobilization nuclease domain-containing protein [Rhizobium sp. NLR22b]|uniref:relaxase/mobilization nuclease domain-containing protein n=1 Tax=Rhizobium sp. NLR22b TaxID=2731115 RepID=UPI001C831456|nr:relaxase/mobilization nuclease domain-containing protein [Rhizobium sp. NLR22b]MBX5242750.1 relaxase/mobilization nuclease domain-containing protein [Rhizobium sp. NLR22b]